jgi:hypothetical protein
MLTEKKAHQLVQILKETASWSREDRLDQIEREIPRANAATIKLALETLLDGDHADLWDLNTKRAALVKQLQAVSRYGELAEDANMTVEEYLARLAQNGDKEAEDLLTAFNNPFTRP